MTPLKLFAIQKCIKDNLRHFPDCENVQVDPFVDIESYNSWVRHFQNGGGAGFLTAIQKWWDNKKYGPYDSY